MACCFSSSDISIEMPLKKLRDSYIGIRIVSIDNSLC